MINDDSQRAFAAHWLGRLALSNTLAIALVVIALLAGIGTYVVMTDQSAMASDPETVSLLMIGNLGLLGLLGLVIAWRVIVLLRARAQGMAGARLHLKLVLTFSFLAVFPAVIVSGLSALFFFSGVQTWFSDSVSVAIQESKAVADAALEAHQRTILADALTIASALNREVGWIGGKEDRLEQVLDHEVRSRGLTDALVFDGNSNRILARASFGFGLRFETIRDVDLDQARNGEVVLMIDENKARVRALVRLERYLDSYLIVSRLTSLELLTHVQRAEEASEKYAAFAAKRTEMQNTIMIAFAVTTLVTLLGASLLGLDVANQLVWPITQLVRASDRVRGGDLTVRVPQSARSSELGTLIRSFNRMTNQLQTQRRELIEANRQLDERNRFTEAILLGVSAGILNVDARGKIQLANTRAAMILAPTPHYIESSPAQANGEQSSTQTETGSGEESASGRDAGTNATAGKTTDILQSDQLIDSDQELNLQKIPTPDDLVGHNLIELLPEIGELFAEAQNRLGKLVDKQLVVKRAGQSTRTIHVRISHEVAGEELRGFVITIDEITDLVSAQRMAAWADVARRIAHEIKNPLTPIQLSAERLKRKYLKQIEQDQNVFQSCIDTIVRQVDDIRRMVDEFSAFARMPAAVIRPFNLAQLIREAVVLEKEAHPSINFETKLDHQDMLVSCDHRQVRQALTNLIQNAINAINERPDATEMLPNGNIEVSLAREGDSVVLSIADNGKGLPVEERDRLTEPYVTTRIKGTGLGLAIVKKIMEDHSGALQLTENPSGGAIVRLIFPIATTDETRAAQADATV